MRTFRNRLLILIIGLVVGAQTVTLITALARTSASETQRAKAQLQGGAQVARELIRYRGRQLDSAVTVLAADFGLREAMATLDKATVASALSNHATRIGADLSLAYNRDGRLIAAGESNHVIDDSVSHTLIDTVAKNPSAAPFITAGNTVYQVFIAPVNAPDQIGWVALGFALDERLSTEMRRMLGVEVLFSTVDEGRASDTEFLSAVTELSHEHPRVLVTLLKPMDEVREPYRQLARMLGLIVGATLIAAIAAGIVLGRSAAKPIQRLAEGAQRIARGDYAHAVEGSGGGEELKDLAHAFNAMQTGIAEREERLLHGARHDDATGLPNRRHAEEWLAQQLEPGKTTDVLVVLLAITNLQELSAGFGFEFAEQLMCHLASALDRAKDENSLVARLDAGRFAVMIGGAAAAQAHSLADELQRRATAPLRVGSLTLRPTVVAGCALAPLHGANAIEILRCAEAAIESARTGNLSVGWFAAANDVAQRRRLKIGADLPPALASDQLRLNYQPKVGLSNRHATSVEALVRWTHAELGELSPAEFVAVAENTGASRLLSQWVLKAALQQLSAWYESGLKIDIAVNLSATDIADPQLLEYILECLRDVRVPAGSLTLEITESVFLVDAAGAKRNMELLRVAGVRFSVDDFGTGYSSLSQLRQLAVDELKIDRSFVEGMISNVEDAAIIRSIIDLGHGLGLKVVAEGVETEEQWRMLVNMGCDYAQGYLISRPVAAAELGTFLRQTAPALSSPLSQTATLQVLEMRRRT